MEDIKAIISENIAELRKESNMTQIELSEKLNYSDKAVSKWERGESTPDITVLKAIADLFGVTVDYLITSEHDNFLRESEKSDCVELEKKLAKKKTKHVMITGMSMLLVLLVALIVFIVIDVATKDISWHWLTFVYGFSASMIVWLVFNSIWFNRRRNYLIISLLVWSVLAAVHLTILATGYNISQFYLLGIPGQLIIVLWSIIGRKV